MKWDFFCTLVNFKCCLLLFDNLLHIHTLRESSHYHSPHIIHFIFALFKILLLSQQVFYHIHFHDFFYWFFVFIPTLCNTFLLSWSNSLKVGVPEKQKIFVCITYTTEYQNKKSKRMEKNKNWFSIKSSWSHLCYIFNSIFGCFIPKKKISFVIILYLQCCQKIKIFSWSK